VCTYIALIFGEIVGCQSICLCNDRNEIDTGTEMLHDFNVKWLKANDDDEDDDMIRQKHNKQ
jgi:hypothetical protein